VRVPEEETISSPSRRNYTLAEIKRSYTPDKAWGELQGDVVCYLVHRPISFYVSALLLRLGVPIMAVTMISAIVAITMIWTAWRGGENAYLWVAMLGFLYPVLDCADGNMARTTGRSSKLGGIVDGTVDMAYWCLLYISLGLLVDDVHGGFFGLSGVKVGMTLAILVLLNRQTRDNYSAHFAEETYFRSERPESISLADRLLIAVVGLEHGYFFAIAIGGWLGGLDWVLAGVAAYVVAIFVGALWMTFAQAAAADRSSASSDPR
jgi:phosphatidylglycerophosphate synthase